MTVFGKGHSKSTCVAGSGFFIDLGGDGMVGFIV